MNEADVEKPITHRGEGKAAVYGSTAGLSQLRIPTVCWYILGVELCERLAFYTLLGSQGFFLVRLGFPLSAAAGINATMWTLCSVLGIFASWVADVVLGRYNTILASSLLYIVGAATASVAAVPGWESADLYLFGVLGLVPFATAGIKANISNLGADQYDVGDPTQQAAQKSFFSIFYCCVNLGAGLSYGVFTTLATSGGLGVPRRWGYFAAYSAMAFCMLFAAIVFWMGRRGYKVHPVQQRSALACLLGCLGQAARRGSWQAVSVLGGLVLLLTSVLLSAAPSLWPSTGEWLLYLGFACAAVGILAVVLPCRDASWLRRVGNNGLYGAASDEERDVLTFLEALPALFIGTLCFACLYNSMQFWYQQQACQMDTRIMIGNGAFQLSGSFFNIANCIAIVTMTPIVVLWLDPCLQHFCPQRFENQLRFSIGVFIAIVSVLCAALLEILRRGSPLLSVTSHCAAPGVYMSDMRGSWMMVPYFLMGLAEVFAQPTLLNLAYSRSPASMRTLASAAYLFIVAVSSALFSLLVSMLSPHIPNDLNTGNLEYGYFVNVCAGAALLLPFLYVLQENKGAPP